MLRTVFGVIVGYFVMFVGAIAGLGVAWLIWGGAGAFREGSTVASNAWVATNLVFGFAAAVLGGMVASVVGKHPTRLPVKTLAVLVLVLSLGLAFASLGVEPQPLPEGKTVAELSFTEAGAVASSPPWYNFAIALIGAAGVLVGGGLRKS